MPMNPADYHPDWAWISRQIRDQAGWCCEWCGIANGSTATKSGYPVVLTVAHLVDDKHTTDPSALVALCQRCHLGHDLPHHVINAANTRRRRRMDAGQTTMELPG